jgi:hypothetical protein
MSKKDLLKIVLKTILKKMKRDNLKIVKIQAIKKSNLSLTLKVNLKERRICLIKRKIT